METEDANYMILPLHRDLRCKQPTPRGQCVNRARWQIPVGKAWQPICYACMDLLVEEYRVRREQQEAAFNTSHIDLKDTEKLD